MPQHVAVLVESCARGVLDFPRKMLDGECITRLGCLVVLVVLEALWMPWGVPAVVVVVMQVQVSREVGMMMTLLMMMMLMMMEVEELVVVVVVVVVVV